MLAVGSSLFILRKCSLARSAGVEQIHSTNVMANGRRVAVQYCVNKRYVSRIVEGVKRKKNMRCTAVLFELIMHLLVVPGLP